MRRRNQKFLPSDRQGNRDILYSRIHCRHAYGYVFSAGCDCGCGMYHAYFSLRLPLQQQPFLNYMPKEGVGLEGGCPQFSGVCKEFFEENI